MTNSTNSNIVLYGASGSWLVTFQDEVSSTGVEIYSYYNLFSSIFINNQQSLWLTTITILLLLVARFIFKHKAVLASYNIYQLLNALSAIGVVIIVNLWSGSPIDSILLLVRLVELTLLLSLAFYLTPNITGMLLVLKLDIMIWVVVLLYAISNVSDIFLGTQFLLLNHVHCQGEIIFSSPALSSPTSSVSSVDTVVPSLSLYDTPKNTLPESEPSASGTIFSNIHKYINNFFSTMYESLGRKVRSWLNYGYVQGRLPNKVFSFFNMDKPIGQKLYHITPFETRQVYPSLRPNANIVRWINLRNLLSVHNLLANGYYQGLFALSEPFSVSGTLTVKDLHEILSITKTHTVLTKGQVMSMYDHSLGLNLLKNFNNSFNIFPLKPGNIIYLIQSPLTYLCLVGKITARRSTLYDQCYSTQSSIPWSMTKASNLAKSSVTKFILEDSKKESDLHKYVNTHCSHLLNMDEQNPNISVDVLNSNTDWLKDKIVNCTPTYSRPITANLAGIAGCYAFFSGNTLQYIGSCINYSSRVWLHYEHYKDQTTSFYKGVYKLGGFQNITFVPVLTSPNRVQEYIKIYGKASLFATSLLRMLTQYEIRLKEQALLDYYKPILNSSQPVIFSLNENKLYLPNKEGSVSVEVVDRNDMKYILPSIKQAKAFTGLNESTITRSANCEPVSWCYSSDLEQRVHFVIDSYPKKEKRASSTDFTPLKYNFDSLALGKVFLLDKDLNLLPQSYNQGIKKALVSIGAPKSKPGKYVNKDFILYSPVLDKQVYVVCNPESLKPNGFRLRPLKAIDTFGLEPDKHFDTGKQLMEHFKLKGQFRNYIVRKLLIHKRYRIYYNDE